jgi:F1F0 ATPase subunit 2
MTDLGTWALAFLAGAVFGAVYLGLIWAGARQIASPRPVTGFVALAAARAALLVGALGGAVALGADAATMIAALAGFVAVRTGATWRVRAAERRASWK